MRNCLICQVEFEQHPRGRTKLVCSEKCRNKRDAQRRLHPKIAVHCSRCLTVFKTSYSHQRYCSDECRYEDYKPIVAERQRKTEPKILICGWCDGEVIVPANFTGNRKYHPECKVQARRARYRIKTVKRQSRTVKPSRLSADQVVDLYGSTCHICQVKIDLDLSRTNRLGLTVDHLVPLSKGGTDTIDNMRPAHWICNVRKGNKTDA